MSEKFIKELSLASGAKAQFKPFKGRDVLNAQRTAGGNEEKFLFALIASTVVINEKAIVAEDLEEMDGRDVLELMGEFGGNFH